MTVVGALGGITTFYCNGVLFDYPYRAAVGNRLVNISSRECVFSDGPYE